MPSFVVPLAIRRFDVDGSAPLELGLGGRREPLELLLFPADSGPPISLKLTFDEPPPFKRVSAVLQDSKFSVYQEPSPPPLLTTSHAHAENTGNARAFATKPKIQSSMPPMIQRRQTRPAIANEPHSEAFPPNINQPLQPQTDSQLDSQDPWSDYYHEVLQKINDLGSLTCKMKELEADSSHDLEISLTPKKNGDVTPGRVITPGPSAASKKTLQTLDTLMAPSGFVNDTLNPPHALPRLAADLPEDVTNTLNSHARAGSPSRKKRKVVP